MRRGALVAAGLLVPGLAWTQANGAGPLADVPIEIYGHRAYARVELEGAGSSWWILDTGASGCVLDARLARSARIPTQDAGRSGGVGTASVARGRAPTLAARLGARRVCAEGASVLPIDSVLSPFTGRREPGIVGHTLFRDHVVELDATARRLRLFDGAGYAYRGGGIIVPIEIEGTAPFVRATLTLDDGTELAARLLVDLGAKAPLLLAEPFVERHGLRAKFDRRVRSTLGAGVGGESRYDFVRLRALRFGPIEERGIVAGLSAEGTIGSAWFDGLLGFDVLAAGRVIFDYPRRRLIIEPPATPGAAKTSYDRSGLVLVARGDRLASFVVHRVVDGGPAAAAGIVRGDSLVSVDDRPASQWTLAALQQRLASPVSPVVLVLSRGETLRTVRLPLRDLL